MAISAAYPPVPLDPSTVWIPRQAERLAAGDDIVVRPAWLSRSETPFNPLDIRSSRYRTEAEFRVSSLF